ncbi:hypothetical protein [Leptothoe sp. PORK10 BA2]|uniref:hypothetical protein n=1 Tax=Leptothoe sp. PORK10 BA2 TaxID=3110254 RepID=UPI002B20BF93|nr:hypothetical protein [Leptothoe sp. PORK10 BA2]MEA5464771.1 hypothetical protein [Leptothoe sp. PORK10 BA2]
MAKISIVLITKALLGCLILWNSTFSKSIAQTIKKDSYSVTIKFDSDNTLAGKQQTNLDIESTNRTTKQLPQEAQLTQPQVNLLKASGIEVVMPTYVPSEFNLEYVNAELARYQGVGGASYRIIFQKYDVETSRSFCFAIEATNGGIGDLPSGLASYSVASQELGESTLEYGIYGESSRPTLLGNWLGTGPFYRFVGSGVYSSLSRCDNISVQEAIKISESLQYLR